MIAVENALKRFLPFIRDHHVLVRSDNMSVVSYVNRQGGVWSRNLCNLTERLRSCGLTARCARAGPFECRPRQTVQRHNSPGRMVPAPSDSPVPLAPIRQSGGRPLWVERQRSLPDVFLEKRGRAVPNLAQPPAVRFPSDLPVTTGHRGDQGNAHPVLLIAPGWENQVWHPELVRLSHSPPWPIPVRKDLLSQAGGSIWHPHPERWSLHAWVINGYPLTCQKGS